MRKLLLGLMLVSGIASADNEMAYISNDAGGYIFFTYSTCVYINTGERVPDSYYVYSTNNNGVKGSDGCYRYKYPFYIIKWNSGRVTNVNVSNVTRMK